MHYLTKKTFIALEAVLYIACHNSSKPVRSRDICDYMAITSRYLEQLLQQLVSHNILKGFRGPKGGYLLARDRRKITVAEIYSSIQGLESTNEDTPSTLQSAVIMPLWTDVEKAIARQLEHISLSDLCDKAQKKNALPESTKTSADFAI